MVINLASISIREQKLKRIMKWVGYYRNNIDLFVRDYMNIRLKLFQRIILIGLDESMMSMFLASRGLGKSF